MKVVQGTSLSEEIVSQLSCYILLCVSLTKSLYIYIYIYNISKFMSFTCWNQTCLTVQNRREYTIGPYFYFGTINLNEKLEKAKISEMVVEKSFESKACLGYSYLFCQDKIIVRKKITLGDTEFGCTLFSIFWQKRQMYKVL